jgi:organic hydroperoxide reductase OsmC/OhrA
LLAEKSSRCCYFQLNEVVRIGAAEWIARYFLQARLHVSLPGLESEAAQVLVKGADQTCPYSKTTLGKIDVAIELDLAGLS